MPGRGRTLGNNSLWSVEEADACIREAVAGLEAALATAQKVGKRGMKLQDLTVVSGASDLQVGVAMVQKALLEALGRLHDARDGVWRGAQNPKSARGDGMDEQMARWVRR